MKQRPAELRTVGKAGAKRADGLQAVLDIIEKMDPTDRALAERVHVTVTDAAPHLIPKGADNWAEESVPIASPSR